MTTKSLKFAVEQLEERMVPATNLLPSLLSSTLSAYSVDGTGNNLLHPTWGSAGTDFLRIAQAAYADGLSSPSGADRPSAREISNAVADQGDADIISDRQLAAMMYAWGQFIDHDLDLSATGTEPFNVAVPTGDPQFDPTGTGTQVIPLKRTGFDSATGTTNARQQINLITSWLDGSMIYGSDATTAASLRTFVKGHLKVSDGNLLPMDASGNFLAGDIRVNENPELTSLQTLFMREHNRLADLIAQANPGLSDEAIFQRARAFVIAEIQVITYKQWLPTLLGPDALRAYSGYKPNVNPAIANEFATAAFRVGHSMLGDDIEFLDNNGLPVADEVELAQAFNNPQIVKDNGIGSMLKYLSSDPSSEIDNMVVNSVRNLLFGAPGSGGLDLASLNIQRGRDHGLGDYNSIRAAYGLRPVISFAQITSDTELQGKLQELYGNVNNIDPWVGMLAENHVPGASVGPTMRAVISNQFTRLRDGDRFFYQNVYHGATLAFLESTTLADVIRRNTEISNLQPNVFVFRVSLSGTVFNDRNRDGRPDRTELGLFGRTIELINADTGEMVGTTTTNLRGDFRFNLNNGLGVGRFQVREVLPAGWVQTTAPSPVVAISRGDQLVRVPPIGNALAPTRPLSAAADLGAMSSPADAFDRSFLNALMSAWNDMK